MDKNSPGVSRRPVSKYPELGLDVILKIASDAAFADRNNAERGYRTAISISILIPAMLCSSASGTVCRAPRYSGVL